MNNSIAYPADFSNINLLQAVKNVSFRHYLSNAVEEGLPRGKDERLSQESILSL